MLNNILAQSEVTSNTITTQALLLCLVASIVFGVIIAAVYMLVSDKYSKNFVITLAIIPVLVQAVIMLVNGQLGTGIAILGAFSLVRFRSIPGTSREICAIFFAMVVGVAAGTGYIGYAAIIVIVVSALLFILGKTPFGEIKSEDKQLRITIPENMNYAGVFDDIFARHQVEYSLDKVKTTNMGSMFELTYKIKAIPDAEEKEMIDSIRERNGNLPISCAKISSAVEEL